MPLFPQHTARFSPDVPLEGTSSRELLKRYQPLETLATGGFGSIEICRDTHLRRRVAIKRIPLINGAGMPASDIMDVLREAHTAAMLQHPNIVQVIDFTHDTAYAYLVMEYVDGMSLADFLHRVDGIRSPLTRPRQLPTRWARRSPSPIATACSTWILSPPTCSSTTRAT